MTTFRVEFVRGKDRPRFTGTGRAYTTKRTHDDEQAIRAAYIDAIEKDIIERDHRDMTRETSPLKQADDAVLLDSSDMTIDEVVDRMKQLVKEA